jgi:transcriptional regulator with XRE-family HTH domain
MVKQNNSREVFGSNLAALMLKHGHSQGFLHRATKLSQSTIGRALTGETSTTIDTIETISRYYDFEPWQMLIPNLDISNPPMLKEISDKEREFYEKIRTAAQELAKFEPDKI